MTTNDTETTICANTGIDTEDEKRLSTLGAPKHNSLESTVTIEILENMPSHLARGIIYILVLVVFIGGLYGYFGKMDIVVQAPGKLIPKGEAAIVQPRTNGILKHIFVKEGDKVEKGALLAELDVTKSTIARKKRASQLKLLQGKIATLETAIRIMKASIKGENLEIDDATIMKIESSAYVNAILALKSARMQYDKAMMQAKEMYPASLKTLESAIKNKKLNLANVRKQSAAGIIDLERTKGQLEIYQTMFAEGLSSKIKLLEEQKKYDEAKAKVESNKVELDTAEGKLEDAIVKYETTKTNYDLSTRQAKKQYDFALLKYDNMLKSMNKALEKLKLELSDFHLDSKLQQQFSGYNRITAPVAGRISFIKLRTPGEVVKAGDTIFIINPANHPLVAKVKISSRSIGRITPGMKAKIKLDAYPYQNYGILSGRVIQVSPDSRKEGKGYVYDATISLARDHVNKDNKEYPLFTGLTLRAEIVVEQQRIIKRFLGRSGN